MKGKWLGKKQVLMGALVVALGAAIYLNYMFASQTTTAVESTGTSTVTTTAATRNLGDSTYVNAEAVTTTGAEEADYFSLARASRESARDEALEIIKDLLDDVRLTDDIQQQAVEKSNAIAQAVTQEEAVEQLVIAKGFEDCVAYVTETSCQLVVKADSLTDEQTLQILDIVQSQTDIAVTNVNITAVNP